MTAEVWSNLLMDDCAALRQQAARCDAGDVAAVARLRKEWPEQLVYAALELASARRKAVDKFDCAERMVGDSTGIEQASSADVAAHKAQRFAEAGVNEIADLCCGIGGDAMALAAVAEVTAFDCDAARVWMARHNVAVATGAPCAGVVGDVTQMNWTGKAFHIDPDRRPGGRRRMNWNEAVPGPDFIERLIDEGENGAVKLPPGIDYDELPPGEVEIISRGGRLVQAVLWTGTLAKQERSATMLPAGVTIGGEPAAIPLAPQRRYLLAVDPAVERAELLGNLAEKLSAPAIHPALGLLTSDDPIVSPWLTVFEVMATMPWREKKVRQWLVEQRAGIVEVKTRDKAVDTDVVQRKLRGKGDEPFTVFILRRERQVTAWITKRHGEC